ncbi:MAG TPA: hypothetical protein DGR79_00995 [Clostridiales bacterium]|nr:hypothetical protein [Clostridiales bacterium]
MRTFIESPVVRICGEGLGVETRQNTSAPEDVPFPWRRLESPQPPSPGLFAGAPGGAGAETARAAPCRAALPEKESTSCLQLETHRRSSS